MKKLLELVLVFLFLLGGLVCSIVLINATRFSREFDCLANVFILVRSEGSNQEDPNQGKHKLNLSAISILNVK